jgi:ketosteroid isomerase-like protein
MKNHLKAVILALLLAPCAAIAEPAAEAWEAEVRQFDAQYWKAYNACDVAALTAMNTDDLEFYHDLGGVSHGKAKFAEGFSKYICGRADGSRVRREGVADSMRFYPMRDGGKLYGAVVAGEHLFHETPKGGKEQLTGRAQFTFMMLLQDGRWKLARVFSFNHGPALR